MSELSSDINLSSGQEVSGSMSVSSSNSSSFVSDLLFTAYSEDGNARETFKTEIAIDSTFLALDFIEFQKSEEILLSFARFFNISFEESTLWSMLAAGTTPQINDSHLKNVYDAISAVNRKVNNFVSGSGETPSSDISSWKDVLDFLNGFDKAVTLKDYFDQFFTTERLVEKLKNTFIYKNQKDSTSGLLVFTDNGIQIGPNYSEGAGILGYGGKFTYDNASGSTTLVTDYLTVRKKAMFTQLEVDEIKAVGGQIILTPAGIKCSAVESHVVTAEEITNGTLKVCQTEGVLDESVLQLNETVYRCYFNDSDEQGEAILNKFEAGDMAICESFNTAAIVNGEVTENVSNKRYWRLVTGTGKNFIDLSNRVGNYETGNIDIPETGDSIVQLGNRYEASRQTAQILSAYGTDAPSHYMYYGINTFSLDKNNVAHRVYTDSGKVKNDTYGDWYVGDHGENAYLKWDSDNKQLVLRGAMIQSKATGKTEYINFLRGAYSENDTYYPGDLVTYSTNNITSTYYCKAENGNGSTAGIQHPTVETYWSVYVQGSQGSSGQSSFTISNSNQMQSIALGGDGKTTKGVDFSTTVRIFYGIQEIPYSGNWVYELKFNGTIIPAGVSTSGWIWDVGSDGEVHFTVSEGISIPENYNIDIKITFTYEGNTHIGYTSVSILALSGADIKIYSIRLSDDQVIYNPNASADNQYNPEAIIATKYIQTSGSEMSITQDGILKVYEYQYGKDPTVIGTAPSPQKYINFDVSKSSKVYKLQVQYLIDNNLRDVQDIFYHSDGVNGATGPQGPQGPQGPTGPQGPEGPQGESADSYFKSIVFQRNEVKPNTPSNTPETGGTWDNPVPEGWSDGIPDGSEKTQLWMSTRIFCSDSGKNGNWTEPQRASDSLDVDFEYSSVENPGDPYGHPNENPNWSNTQSSSTIWMAISYFRNGEWSAWEVMKVKGEKGERGPAGTSGDKIIHWYKNSSIEPANPLGFDISLNDGWRSSPEFDGFYILDVNPLVEDGTVNHTIKTKVDENGFKWYGISFSMASTISHDSKSVLVKVKTPNTSTITFKAYTDYTESSPKILSPLIKFNNGSFVEFLSVREHTLSSSDGVMYVTVNVKAENESSSEETFWFRFASTNGVTTDNTVWKAEGILHADGTGTWNSVTRFSSDSKGPLYRYEANYLSSKSYYCNDEIISIVRVYDSEYDAYTYFKAISNVPPNVIPGTTVNWELFWEKFLQNPESIATSLLLSEKAVVENLIVKYLNTAGDVKEGTRIEVDGNTLKAYTSNNEQTLVISGDSISDLTIPETPYVSSETKWLKESGEYTYDVYTNATVHKYNHYGIDIDECALMSLKSDHSYIVKFDPTQFNGSIAFNMKLTSGDDGVIDDNSVELELGILNGDTGGFETIATASADSVGIGSYVTFGNWNCKSVILPRGVKCYLIFNIHITETGRSEEYYDKAIKYTLYWSGLGNYSIPNFFKVVLRGSEIGNNGILSRWGENRYLRVFNSDTSTCIESRADNCGIKVSSVTAGTTTVSSLEGMTDGTYFPLMSLYFALRIYGNDVYRSVYTKNSKNCSRDGYIIETAKNSSPYSVDVIFKNSDNQYIDAPDNLIVLATPHPSSAGQYSATVIRTTRVSANSKYVYRVLIYNGSSLVDYVGFSIVAYL